jgi:hypothetical protein
MTLPDDDKSDAIVVRVLQIGPQRRLHASQDDGDLSRGPAPVFRAQTIECYSSNS